MLSIFWMLRVGVCMCGEGGGRGVGGVEGIYYKKKICDENLFSLDNAE